MKGKKQTHEQSAKEDPMFQSERKGRGYHVRKYSLNQALVANRCATRVKNVEVLFFIHYKNVHNHSLWHRNAIISSSEHAVHSLVALLSGWKWTKRTCLSLSAWVPCSLPAGQHVFAQPFHFFSSFLFTKFFLTPTFLILHLLTYSWDGTLLSFFTYVNHCTFLSSLISSFHFVFCNLMLGSLYQLCKKHIEVL